MLIWQEKSVNFIIIIIIIFIIIIIIIIIIIKFHGLRRRASPVWLTQRPMIGQRVRSDRDSATERDTTSSKKNELTNYANPDADWTRFVCMIGIDHIRSIADQKSINYRSRKTTSLSVNSGKSLHCVTRSRRNCVIVH